MFIGIIYFMATLCSFFVCRKNWPGSGTYTHSSARDEISVISDSRQLSIARTIQSVVRLYILMLSTSLLSAMSYIVFLCVLPNSSLEDHGIHQINNGIQ